LLGFLGWGSCSVAARIEVGTDSIQLQSLGCDIKVDGHAVGIHPRSPTPDQTLASKTPPFLASWRAFDLCELCLGKHQISIFCFSFFFFFFTGQPAGLRAHFFEMTSRVLPTFVKKSIHDQADEVKSPTCFLRQGYLLLSDASNLNRLYLVDKKGGGRMNAQSELRSGIAARMKHSIESS
jgi:hypothetical protein